MCELLKAYSMDICGAGSTEEHEQYMRRCIELAKLARNQGNTPVGSVVVLGGEVVGEGVEGLPGGTNIAGHAEVLACQMAVDRTGSRRLDGATLYTTAEPCFMCSYVIRQCNISQVVYGLPTPDVGGVTSSHAILTDTNLLNWMPAPRVLGGILREECRQLASTTIE
ncbi:MAG: deaminase [Pirellulales bacterium]|nr:deaminase [Pirellulales bacterium]